jgi:hypothetical protein
MPDVVSRASIAPVGDDFSRLADLAGFLPSLQGVTMGVGLGPVVIPHLAADPSDVGQI